MHITTGSLSNRALEMHMSTKIAAAMTGIVVGGCNIGLAPAIPGFGAYFPSWIPCSLVGIIGAVIVRLVFIRIGIDDLLPLRVVVYFLLAIAIGLAASLVIFGR